MVTATTRNRWNATTIGTPIWSDWATIVISGMPPGAVEMIMVANYSPKPQNNRTATPADANMMKKALSRANGMNILWRAKNARS